MTAFFLLRQIVFAVVLLLGLCGLGQSLLTLCKIRPARTLENLFFSICTGMGIVIFYVLLLSCIGLCIGSLVLLIIPIGVLLFFRRPLPGFQILWIPSVVLFPAFLVALYPSLGWDDTSYHLPVAQAILHSHQLQFFSYLRSPVFPIFGELFFVLGLSIDQITAQLQSWLCLLILTVGCAAILDARLHQSPAAWWRAPHSLLLGSALFLLSCRMLVILSTICYIDIVLAVFVAAAIFSFCMYVEKQNMSYLWLSAVFCGISVGTKYTAIIIALGLCVFLIAQRKLLIVVQFGILLATIASPCYARMLYYMKNPVWPFLAKWFGYHNFWSSADYQAQFLDLQKQGHQNNLLDILRVPLDFILQEEMGRGFLEINPLLFVGVALLFVGRSRVSERFLAWSLLSFFGVWCLSYRHARYFVPVICLGWVLTGLRLAHMGLVRRWVPCVALALLLSGALIGWSMIAVDLVRFGAIPSTQAARDAYLQRYFPTYAATRWATQQEGLTYALASSSLFFYGEGKVIGDMFGPTRYADVQALLNTPDALHAHLQKLRCRRLLIDKTACPSCPLLRPPLFAVTFEDRSAIVYERSP